MPEIRPFEHDDLPLVSSLLREILPDWMSDEEVPRFLAASLLDIAWTDPDLPPLVAVEDRQVVGFIGSQVRRYRLDDRELRAVCSSHLTVAADHRGSAVG